MRHHWSGHGGQEEGAVLVTTKMRRGRHPRQTGPSFNESPPRALPTPLRTPTPVPRVLPGHHTASQTLTARVDLSLKPGRAWTEQSRGC